MIIPNIWENKNVPNHQPEIHRFMDRPVSSVWWYIAFCPMISPIKLWVNLICVGDIPCSSTKPHLSGSNCPHHSKVNLLHFSIAVQDSAVFHLLQHDAQVRLSTATRGHSCRFRPKGSLNVAGSHGMFVMSDHAE